MLRVLFDEPRRQDAGKLKQANDSIRRYIGLLSSLPANERNLQERRYMIWSGSLLRSLDELEQSQYAAIRYGSGVRISYIDEMSEQERDDYYRHLYFYNNAIIRLFAIVDKLGHFMNERFRLKTEAVKTRFSYFTVLRNMRQNGLYIELEEQLYGLKTKYKQPMERLRKQRNLEIHMISSDLLDDLLKAAEAKQDYDERMKTENVQQHLTDLAEGCAMAYEAAIFVFGYIHKLSEASGRYRAAAAQES